MSGTVHFTKEQVEYLMIKTGADDPDEALEIFATLIRRENIEATKMPFYIKKLMEKEGMKK